MISFPAEKKYFKKFAKIKPFTFLKIQKTYFRESVTFAKFSPKIPSILHAKIP